MACPISFTNIQELIFLDKSSDSVDYLTRDINCLVRSFETNNDDDVIGYQLHLQHLDTLRPSLRVNTERVLPTNQRGCQEEEPLIQQQISPLSGFYQKTNMQSSNYRTRDVYCKVQNNNKLSTTFLVTTKDADIENQAISVNGDVQEPVTDVNGVLQVRRDQFVLSRDNHNEIPDDPGDELVMLSSFNLIHRFHCTMANQQFCICNDESGCWRYCHIKRFHILFTD